ncbi:hypothetical protein BGZ61DRAFT_470812 [Ilyonectria robusta]|uniref:uncharacterized protein n=1 Tax=Ilyonectria robusta TaxID=1079257 RepID=UPI001E8E0190|nr:uncharacterized protein BGZ61DRAFT_470812 [Ilyonectria robusta]KAH8737359.1 hypothetical protein BGZ61DRAFT_470812 [Ilyonectria robusta]
MRPRTSEVDQRGANGSVLMRVFQYYSVAFTAPQPVRAPAHVLVLVDLGNVVRSRDSVLRSAGCIPAPCLFLGKGPGSGASSWLISGSNAPNAPNAPNADHTESAMFRPGPLAVNPPLREPMGWPPFPVPSCVILVDCGMEITCCDSPSCRLRQLERPERRAANHDPEIIDDPERRWSTEQGNGQQTQDSAHAALPCVALRRLAPR